MLLLGFVFCGGGAGRDRSEEFQDKKIRANGIDLPEVPLRPPWKVLLLVGCGVSEICRVSTRLRKGKELSKTHVGCPA